MLNRKLTLADAKNWAGRTSSARPGPRRGSRKATGSAPATSTPTTHTRLPRYARGKLGTVEAIRGVHVYPDTAALGDHEHAEWLYTVVFPARELWGEAADPAQGLDRGVRAVSRPGMTDRPEFAEAARGAAGLPRDAGGPVFREPWEAQAFAMTVALYRRGLFTWPEWAETLGARSSGRRPRAIPMPATPITGTG